MIVSVHQPSHYWSSITSYFAISGLGPLCPKQVQLHILSAVDEIQHQALETSLASDHTITVGLQELVIFAII